MTDRCQQFETWAYSQGMILDRGENGGVDYYAYDTEAAWAAWQFIIADTDKALQAMTLERDSCKQDALRYRWLRYGDNDERVIMRGPIQHDYVYLLRMEKLDTAIDGALAPTGDVS